MSSFLGQPVDIPCRSFVDLKSTKANVKLIEFLNQSYLVLLNGRKLDDSSSKLTCSQLSGSSTVNTMALYLGTGIVRYNTLTSVWFSDYIPVQMSQVIGTTIRDLSFVKSRVG